MTPTATRRQRVLMFAYFFPPLGGGVVQRTLKFVKYLPSEGFESIVVAGRPPSFWVVRDGALNGEVPQGTRIVRAPTLPIHQVQWKLDGLFRRAGLPTKTIRKALLPTGRWGGSLRPYGMGCVQCVGTDPMSSTARQCPKPDTWLRSSSTGSLVCHGSQTSVTPGPCDPDRIHRPTRRRHVPMPHWSGKMADASYTTVACDSIQLLGRPPSDRRRIVIPNGVDPDDIAVAGGAESSVDPDRFRLAYVGSLYGSRDAAPVFDAVSELIARGRLDAGRFELRIVGDAQLNGQRRDAVPTTLTGYVDHRRAVAEMAGASVLLLHQPAEQLGSSSKNLRVPHFRPSRSCAWPIRTTLPTVRCRSSKPEMCRRPRFDHRSPGARALARTLGARHARGKRARQRGNVGPLLTPQAGGRSGRRVSLGDRGVSAGGGAGMTPDQLTTMPPSQSPAPTDQASAETPSRRPSLTRQTGALFAASLFSQASSVLLLMALTRLVPKAQLGAYQQLTLLYGIVSPLLVAGIPTALLYFIPRSRDSKDTSLWIGEAYVLLGLLGLVCSIAVALARTPIAHALGNQALSPVLLIYAPVPFLSFITAVMSPALVAVRRTALAAKLGVFSSCVVLITMLAAVTLGRDAKHMAAALVISQAGVAIVSTFVIHRTLGISMVRARLVRGAAGLLRFGLPLALTGLAGMFAFQFDRLVVSRDFSPALYAVYAVGAVELPLLCWCSKPSTRC